MQAVGIRGYSDRLLAQLVLLYSNTLPLLRLFVLSCAVAMTLPAHPPMLLRKWLLSRVAFGRWDNLNRTQRTLEVTFPIAT